MYFSKCSIGIFLNDACKKLTWTNNIGVYTKDDLSQIYLKPTELRSGVNNIVNYVIIIMNSTGGSTQCSKHQ